MPEGTNYYGVTFADVRIFLLDLNANATSESIHVTAVKGGTSVFKDKQGEIHRFTHRATDPPFAFDYNGGSEGNCKALTGADPRLHRDGDYVNYSPYGTWSITAPEQFSRKAAGVRFEFLLNYQQGTFPGANTLFENEPSGNNFWGKCAASSDDKDGLGPDSCVEHQSALLRAQPPVAPSTCVKDVDALDYPNNDIVPGGIKLKFEEEPSHHCCELCAERDAVLWVWDLQNS